MSQLNALQHDDNQLQVETYEFEPIKGYPRLHWKGKRAFRSTHYYPAQLKESYGDPPTGGWMNEIYWGDNLQVMSHLLKKYRGKIDLIYIDPPFDSKADYKIKIKLRGKELSNDHHIFEEKQYSDLWVNDEYLQFMYERIIMIRELLSYQGSIYIHCDWHKSHYLRCIMDEVFGQENFIREIIWNRGNPSGGKAAADNWIHAHDNILYYAKNKDQRIFTKQYIPYSEEYIEERFLYDDNDGNGQYRLQGSGDNHRKQYLKDSKGRAMTSVWDIADINVMAQERTNYPTQKPKNIIDYLILSSSNEGNIVLDCYMGCGSTQESSMKLGRRFIGADINAGAIQTTIKRLINTAEELKSKSDKKYYTGFAVYNVNQYDIFRNELEAKDLIIKALEIERLNSGSIFDGTKDEFKIKIMPINRIATRKDVSDLVNNLDYKTYEKTRLENPMKSVDDIMLVCMGHEPDLAAHFKKETEKYRINLKVYDILKDGSHLTFKRDSEANIESKNNVLEIKQFYPTMLLEKLRKQNETVTEFRELAESVMIDPYYDGAVFTPTIKDFPGKHEFIKGMYELPADHGRVAIKITDLLSETFFTEVSQTEKEDLYV